MDIGFPELLIVLAIVVVLFGPGRFGKVLGDLGSGLRTFKENLSGEKQGEPAPKITDQNSDKPAE